MMNTQLYIGIMSGTSMDGADAVLIRMQGTRWLAAEAHAFAPYGHTLKADLLDLQHTGSNELHRSMLLSQQLSALYAGVTADLLAQQGLAPADITAIGCHGQTVRHAPEAGYSIQLADWARLAELSGIFTIGDFAAAIWPAVARVRLWCRRFTRRFFTARTKPAWCSTSAALPTSACCRTMHLLSASTQAPAIC